MAKNRVKLVFEDSIHPAERDLLEAAFAASEDAASAGKETSLDILADLL